ncbi:hypothetical protein C6A87_027130 [Mycobacterium sp. ITM-2016-00317]|uniref:hypothetical protein n=1 Tax=Mycobacterium sp. ITM-2016-00317 TaxID=2099694 RepID=UPI00287F6E1E|nr:hypothetical protein [Mycobacterium sp. ITM-2016-00317]WNG87372.1 hypothetical protein C6A87_027130 [Mycobacterium sp. ITM-2016-00317]
MAAAGMHLRGGADEFVERRVAWDPPPQMFLASSMEHRPVAGWRLAVTDFGLPDGSRFVTDPMPMHSAPLVGSIEERAFLLSQSPGTTAPQWWLVGANSATGQPLFAPVPLNSGGKPACFLNGTDAVLCITPDTEGRTAWVISSRTGHVVHSGPTDLNVRPNELNARQVGIHAVAESEHEGVYGIGPEAQTTWFVPGAGDTSLRYLRRLDISPPAIASQTSSGRGSFGTVTFSLTDGRVIKPDLPDGAEQQETLIYPGGFAAVIDFGQFDRKILLFDEQGRQTTDEAIDGRLPPQLPFFDLPVLTPSGDGHEWRIYTPHGGKVFESDGKWGWPERLVGSRLIVNAGEFETRGWAQFDLRTGQEGKRCTDLDMAAGYLGYDGRIAVTSDGNPTVGLDTVATDLDTCERLWVVSSPPGSWRNVWRIGTALVQLSDEGTELTSLVAPGPN